VGGSENARIKEKREGRGEKGEERRERGKWGEGREERENRGRLTEEHGEGADWEGDGGQTTASENGDRDNGDRKRQTENNRDRKQRQRWPAKTEVATRGIGSGDRRRTMAPTLPKAEILPKADTGGATVSRGRLIQFLIPRFLFGTLFLFAHTGP
jgi:hypothetical protein